MNGSAFLIDTNIWTALTFPSHPAHQVTSRLFEEIRQEQKTAIFCRATQQSFLRLITTPTLLRTYGVMNFTNRDALVILTQMLTDAHVEFRDEPNGTAELWYALADRGTASPNLWMDAYLAAFAIKGELTMLTLDRAFGAFRPNGLRLQHVVAK